MQDRETVVTAEIGNDLQRQLYREMLRIRVVEETIARLYPAQEMRCPVHLCIGQEAIPAGVCAHLDTTDYVLSNHRSHGHYLAKGGDLTAFLAELYGRASGCAGGRGGSMHLIDLQAGFLGSVPIVAATIPIAVGAAWGSVLQEEKRVVVSFFGEGAVEEGTFHEAVRFAAVKKLPIVFVCENNLYSVYSPLDVRYADGNEACDLAKGHGIPAWQADGNDVLAVYASAQKAIDIARSGGGPSFIEFKTYRWLEHCGPYFDNDLGYRTEAEFQDWKARCPLTRMEQLLRETGLLNQQEIDKTKAGLQTEIERIAAEAKDAPPPDPGGLLGHTYAS